VIHVSWNEAVEYAKRLSAQTGKSYRLPTEAEWEYAERSGGEDDIWDGTSDEMQLAEYAVFRKSQTETVGSRKPNGLGLYDMSGNVWEWVEDCWHPNYTGAPTDGSAWLEAGGGHCGQRVVRGGSWYDFPVLLRSSFRLGYLADTRYNFLGFRLAQDIE
jgi:formylglycine-generating enzyme required for sulfatase activity